MPDSWILPRYDGGSILNVSAEVLHQFALPGSWPGLTGEALPENANGEAGHVVLMVVDALGQHQLDAARLAGGVPFLDDLLSRPEVRHTTLTSIFPSTTPAALATLCSGLSPAEHGLMGFTLWFEEIGETADMLHWQSRPSGVDVFERVQPKLPTTIFQQLSAAEIATYVVNDNGFKDSPLSRLIFKGANYLGYKSPSSIPVLVDRALKDAGDTTAFIWSYWPGLDVVCHPAGPGSREHAEELRMIDGVLRRLCEELLGRNVLLLIVADHGHVATHPDTMVILDEVEGMEELLASPTAGGKRAAYLRAREGKAGALREAVFALFDGAVQVLSPGEALSQGWFGAKRTEHLHRTGDWLVLPHGSRRLWSDSRGQKDRGGHGGMTPEEMHVPFIAVRC